MEILRSSVKLDCVLPAISIARSDSPTLDRADVGLERFAPREARLRTREVLEKVGIAEAMDRAINTYSLGMRQRCKLAQAIATEPQLLILDEPFNGLDPVGRHQMTELLVEWANRGRSYSWQVTFCMKWSK